MSNQKEEYCPLCTEEMDPTDQLFKPCTCGYQICVWCWNHLVEESEKDEVLCPACRSPYDKEKIKGMTISSDRLEEISSMMKQKINKTKPRTSELRYDPNKSRVVQRNLVYTTGIPVNLANKETLCKREFFGQYGKILKIYIKPSRPGSPHYTKTSAVYVTFSNEEEAIKCIQLINGFVLNGSLLKACYGTSRYCNFWLLKKPCKNQDCPYLHTPAPQGDICTKDDVASACTSFQISKLQHYVRTASLVQQCSESSLPPPADSYYSSTEKPLVSSVTPSPFGSGENLRSGENEKSSVPSRPASCGLTVASDKASCTSTAVCEGPFNTSSVANSSITPPTVMEVHVLEQARDEYQHKERTFMPGCQSQGLGGPQNHESSQQDRQFSYPTEHIVATSEVSPGNNAVVTSTVSKLYCLWDKDDIMERIMPDPDCLDSRGFKQKTSVSHDLTRKISPSILCSATNRVSFASSSQLSSIPVRECPVTSIQDSPISYLQDMTLSSPYPQKVPHVNRPSGYSDLELTELTSKSEAKGTSVYSKGIGSHDTSSIIIGQKVGKFPPFLNNAIGTSFQGEPKKLHTKNSGCLRQDFELKDTKHSSDHNSVEDMVQNVDAWCKNSVDLKDIISCVDSEEHIIKSDMSSMKPGLAGCLATHQSLADRVDGGTYRGGDCSNVFNSWLPFGSSASTVGNLGGAKHTSGQSLQGSMDDLVPNKEYRGVHVVEKMTVQREESTNKPTVSDLKNFKVQTNELTTEVVNEPKHLMRLHQPASSITKPTSSITKSVISPPPRKPPGLPLTQVSHEGQKCSRPSSSGNVQYKFSGKQSLINSSQTIPRSDSYFNMEPIDAIKMQSRGEMLQSATDLTSPLYSSSLVGLDGSEQSVQSQLSVGSRYQNPVEVDQSKIYLPHLVFYGADTNYGSEEACTFGSPAAMDSRVIGRRGQTGSSNSRNNGTSILHHQFLQPFSGQSDPEFQTTDFSSLYYSQSH